MQFVIAIPVRYKTPYLSTPMQLIEIGDIQITAQYDNRELDATWSASALTPPAEHVNTPQEAIIENHHNNQFDSIPSDFIMQGGENTDLDSFTNRRFVRSYNRYTRQVSEYSSNNMQLTPTEIEIANLPANRLIYFNCSERFSENEHNCVRAFIRIKEFKAGDKTAIVKVHFSIDLQKIGNNHLLNYSFSQ